MRLPNFKRLMGTDFDKDNQDLVNKLAISINSGFESLYQAIARRLNFVDNIQSTIKDIVVIVDANGTPEGSVGFKLDDKTMKITGCLLIDCQNLDYQTYYPRTAPFVYWTQDQNGIKINNVAGLEAGYRYRLRLLVV